MSYLSGELQHISHLCQDSLFSKIVAIPAFVPINTAATLLGSLAVSSPAMSISVPADQFISNEATVTTTIRAEASLSSPGMSFFFL